MMIVGDLHVELPLRCANMNFDPFEGTGAHSYRGGPLRSVIGWSLPSFVITGSVVGIRRTEAAASRHVAGDNVVCGEAHRHESIAVSTDGMDKTFSQKCVASSDVSLANPLISLEKVSAHLPS